MHFLHPGSSSGPQHLTNSVHHDGDIFAPEQSFETRNIRGRTNERNDGRGALRLDSEQNLRSWSPNARLDRHLARETTLLASAVNEPSQRDEPRERPLASIGPDSPRRARRYGVTYGHQPEPTAGSTALDPSCPVVPSTNGTLPGRLSQATSSNVVASFAQSPVEQAAPGPPLNTHNNRPREPERTHGFRPWSRRSSFDEPVERTHSFRRPRLPVFSRVRRFFSPRRHNHESYSSSSSSDHTPRASTSARPTWSEESTHGSSRSSSFTAPSAFSSSDRALLSHTQQNSSPPNHTAPTPDSSHSSPSTEAIIDQALDTTLNELDPFVHVLVHALNTHRNAIYSLRERSLSVDERLDALTLRIENLETRPIPSPFSTTTRLPSQLATLTTRLNTLTDSLSALSARQDILSTRQSAEIDTLSTGLSNLAAHINTTAQLIATIPPQFHARISARENPALDVNGVPPTWQTQARAGLQELRVAVRDSRDGVVEMGDLESRRGFGRQAPDGEREGEVNGEGTIEEIGGDGYVGMRGGGGGEFWMEEHGEMDNAVGVDGGVGERPPGRQILLFVGLLALLIYIQWGRTEEILALLDDSDVWSSDSSDE